MGLLTNLFSSETLGSWIEGSLALFGALIAMVGVILTLRYSMRIKWIEFQDEQDSKANWRGNLMDTVSRDQLTRADLLRIRASLRYLPSGDDSDSFFNMNPQDFKDCKIENFSMNNVANAFIIWLEDGINRKDGSDQLAAGRILTSLEAKVVRIMARYMLKWHWDSRSSLRLMKNPDRYFKSIRFYELSRENVSEIRKVLGMKADAKEIRCGDIVRVQVKARIPKLVVRLAKKCRKHPKSDENCPN